MSTPGGCGTSETLSTVEGRSAACGKPSWWSPGLWLLLAALAVVAAIGFCGADLAIASQVRQWQISHPGSGWHVAAYWFSKTGSLVLYPLAALALLVYARWVRPNDRIWRTALWWLTAEALNGLAGLAIKLVVGRWRPNQPLAGTFEFLQRYRPKCQSFPSGHTADVAAVATVLWLACPRLRPLCLLWVVMMAAARIVEMQHFLSDTAVGAALGILCALVVGRNLVPMAGAKKGRLWWFTNAEAQRRGDMGSQSAKSADKKVINLKREVEILPQKNVKNAKTKQP